MYCLLFLHTAHCCHFDDYGGEISLCVVLLRSLVCARDDRSIEYVILFCIYPFRKFTTIFVIICRLACFFIKKVINSLNSFQNGVVGCGYTTNATGPVAFDMLVLSIVYFAVMVISSTRIAAPLPTLEFITNAEMVDSSVNVNSAVYSCQLLLTAVGSFRYL